MEQPTDPIWYNQPSVLWNKPLEVFPLKYSEMTSTEQRINSMVRLAIYLLIAALLLSRRLCWRIFVLVGMFLIGTVFFYENEKRSEPFAVPYNFSNMVQPKYAQPEIGQSRDLQNSILDDIHNTMYIEGRPNKDMRFFSNQINREKVHYRLLNENTTPNGDIFTHTPYSSHMKSINKIFG
jgi:hypothetical protein